MEEKIVRFAPEMSFDEMMQAVSRMTMLSPEERIREIAQMLSGSDVSDAAIQNAKTLLKIK